jgi:predicted transposase YdaD
VVEHLPSKYKSNPSIQKKRKEGKGRKEERKEGRKEGRIVQSTFEDTVV